MKKRVISLIMSAVMVTSAALTGANVYAEGDLPFSDVPEKNWYYPYVKTAYEYGIIDGKEPTIFDPDAKLTRAQTVTVLSRLAGADPAGDEDKASEFSDINGNEWYSKYVGWGVKSGLVKGYDDNTFRAEDPVLRQELAAFFTRFLEYMKLELKDENAVKKFADEGLIPEWAKEYVEAVRVTGLMNGDGGNFRPESTTTRAEVATVAARLIKYINESGDKKTIDVKADGTEFCFAYNGEFASEQVFAEWLREQADEKHESENMNIENFADVKKAADELRDGDEAKISVKVVFAKSGAENVRRNYTVILEKNVDYRKYIPENGSEYSYTGRMRKDLFEAFISRETGGKFAVSVENFEDLAELRNNLEPGSSAGLEIKTTFKRDGEDPINEVRMLKITVSRPDDRTDPTPDNIGVVYEQDGIKISNVIDVGGYLANESLGYHGGHETRIARNEYGTYMVFLDDMRYDEKHPEGSNYSDFFYWMKGSIYKIESTGVKKIYSFEYPRTMCAAPNIIAGDGGMFYVAITADDKEKYLDAGLNDEGAWLAIYELDSKTDTVRESKLLADYEYGWPEYYTGGYGYSQPLFDRDRGLMYFLSNGGMPESYMAIFTYDVNKHEWINGCNTFKSSWRLGYMNCYVDEDGGLVLVAQRAIEAKYLADYYDIPMAVNDSSYIWDALYIVHIPDPTDVSTATITPIVEPDYANNMNANGTKAKLQNTKHYAGGCTYLDDAGNLHVLYLHSIGTKKTNYHVIYDKDLKEIYRDTFAPAEGSKSYTLNLTQGAGGKFYLLVTSLNISTLKLEVWESEDGINFTRTIDPYDIKNPETGEVFKRSDKVIIATGRNYSDLDGTISVVFADYDKTERYYYFSIEVPN